MKRRGKGDEIAVTGATSQFRSRQTGSDRRLQLREQLLHALRNGLLLGFQKTHHRQVVERLLLLTHLVVGLTAVGIARGF